MSSRSAKIASERPFYDVHADAYDALITDPVEPWVDAIDQHLRDAGFQSASILDAGCGTGRHAAALIGRGHRLTLLDAAHGLLTFAARRCPGSRAILADICAPPLTETFDAVTCRGVLNDLVEDAERDQVVASGAAALPRAYTFRMRPWTTAELECRLRRGGFQRIEIQLGRRTTDRLLVTARR